MASPTEIIVVEAALYFPERLSENLLKSIELHHIPLFEIKLKKRDLSTSSRSSISTTCSDTSKSNVTYYQNMKKTIKS